MNEITITLTEEQWDTIDLALTFLVKHDEMRIAQLNGALDDMGDASRERMRNEFKPSIDRYKGQLADCTRIQNTIESRKAHATA